MVCHEAAKAFLPSTVLISQIKPPSPYHVDEEPGSSREAETVLGWAPCLVPDPIVGFFLLSSGPVHYICEQEVVGMSSTQPLPFCGWVARGLETIPDPSASEVPM